MKSKDFQEALNKKVSPTNEDGLQLAIHNPDVAAPYATRIAEIALSMTTLRQGSGDVGYATHPTSPRDVQKRAIEALWTIHSESRSEELTNISVVDRLCKIYNRTSEDVIRDTVLGLLTKIGNSSDRELVESHLVPFLRSVLSEALQDPVDHTLVVDLLEQLSEIRTHHAAIDIEQAFEEAWAKGGIECRTAVIRAIGEVVHGPNSERIFKSFEKRFEESLNIAVNDDDSHRPFRDSPSTLKPLSLLPNLTIDTSNEDDVAQMKYAVSVAILGLNLVCCNKKMRMEGKRILNNLIEAEAIIRQAVPGGISIIFRSSRTDNIDTNVLAEWLNRTITDNETSVQVSTIEAIRQGIEQDTHPKEPLFTAYDEALEKLDPDTDTEAYRHAAQLYDSIPEFLGPTSTEQIEVDLSEYAPYLRDLVISTGDPELRETLQKTDFSAVSELFEDDEQKENRGRKTQQLSSTKQATPDPQRVRRIVEKYLENSVPPNRLNDRYERGDVTTRIAIVEVINRLMNVPSSKLYGDLGRSRSFIPSLFKILTKAWESDTVRIRIDVIKTLATGLENGHLEWDTIKRFYQDGFEDPSSQTRRVTLSSLKQAIESGNIDCDAAKLTEYISTSIHAELEEGSFSDLHVPCMSLLTSALETGELSWSTLYCSNLGDKDILDENNDIAFESVSVEELILVGSGLATGNVNLGDIKPAIFQVQENGSRPAIAAIQATKHGIAHKKVTWASCSDLLSEANSHSNPEVARQAIEAVGLGILNGSITWENADSFLSECIDNRDPKIGKEVPEAIGKGLQEGAIQWERAQPLLEHGLNHNSTTISIETIRAAGVGFHHGDLSWDQVKNILKKGQSRDNPEVAGLAVQAIGGGVPEEKISWEEIRPILNKAKDREFVEVARPALIAIRDSIQTEIVSFKRAKPFLESGLYHDDSEVARQSIRSAGVGLSHAEISWTEVKSILEKSLFHDDSEVATESLNVIASNLQHGDVSWETVSGFLENSLLHPDPQVAREAIRAAGSGLHHGDLLWEDVQTFMKRGLSHDSNEVVKISINAIEVGVRMGEINWPDADLILQEIQLSTHPDIAHEVLFAARNCLAVDEVPFDDVKNHILNGLTTDQPEVAQEAIKAGGVFIHLESVSWTAVESLFETTLDHGSPEITREALKIIGSGLLKGSVEWSEVESLLRAGLDFDSPECAGRVFQSVAAGLQEGNVEWSEIESLLRTGLNIDSPDIAEHVPKIIATGLQSGHVEWHNAQKLLEKGLDHNSTKVARECVRTAGTGLHHGEQTWADVSAFLERGFCHTAPEVAGMAINAIGVGIQMDVVSWEAAKPTFERALDRPDPALSSTAFNAISNAFKTENVTLDQAEPLLEYGVESDNPDIASAAILSLGPWLDNNRWAWGKVESLLESGLDHESSGVAEASLRLVGLGFQNGHSSWEAVESFFNVGLDHESSDVVKEALKAVLVGLREEQVDWSEVETFLKEGLKHDSPDVAKESIRAAGSGLHHGGLAWNDVEAIIESGLHKDDPVANMSLQAAGVGLLMGEASWNGVKSIFHSAQKITSPQVARGAVKFVRAADDRGRIQWDVVSEFVHDMLNEQSQVPALTRSEAIRLLDRSQNRAVSTDRLQSTLKIGLEDQNPSIRVITLQVLGRLIDNSPLTIDVVETLLDNVVEDPDSQVRQLALIACHRSINNLNSETNWFRETVCERARVEPEDRIRAVAFKIIEEYPGYFGANETLVDTIENGVIGEQEANVSRIALSCAQTYYEVAPSIRESIADIVQRGIEAEQTLVKEAAGKALVGCYRHGSNTSDIESDQTNSLNADSDADFMTQENMDRPRDADDTTQTNQDLPENKLQHFSITEKSLCETIVEGKFDISTKLTLVDICCHINPDNVTIRQVI